ncbi:hypothetical protein BJY00DRAFT_125475 [Aspergillus carlsbadensis]|nr:hypothetical protein BJY00DRAFT_125475 [Aspergillus carlsbadensis]
MVTRSFCLDIANIGRVRHYPTDYPTGGFLFSVLLRFSTLMHALGYLWGLQWNLRCAAATIGYVSLCKRVLLFLLLLGVTPGSLQVFSEAERPCS